ncbi:MAG: HAMP domain-containing histidine kinase [Spirochaetales bacterium]|nr:HAMP domain-containing histidine kinase [Spirochaetales bacterium]
MEKLKSIPFYRRYGLKVFLFLAILILGIIRPTQIIRKSDFHDMMERLDTHNSLYWYCLSALEKTAFEDWPEKIKNMPKLFFRQRIIIFNTEREPVFDSGIMKSDEAFRPLGLMFHHPYIVWGKNGNRYRPEVYINHLLAIDTDELDPWKTFKSLRNVRYPEGIDRVFLTGRMIESADGIPLVFTLSQSLTDMLMHARAIKERFLILYAVICLAALALGALLSWSVTGPLNRLYNYSLKIQTSKWQEVNPAKLPVKGEIGFICRALQDQIRDEKIQAEHFREFSSDITHELKTPLAAIRSGLEVYSETDEKAQKADILDRIMKRISRMEDLINQINYMGNIEARTNEELCCSVPDVLREVLSEFADEAIRFELSPSVTTCCVSISCRDLFQVVFNLLKNAVSFSPERGSVSLSAGLRNDFLAIEVQDRGPGIAPEVFENICRRFYTYRNKDRENHSGLGLAIVETSLRKSGGRLEYRNRTAAGAEFSCFVPLVKTGNRE